MTDEQDIHEQPTDSSPKSWSPTSFSAPSHSYVYPVRSLISGHIQPVSDQNRPSSPASTRTFTDSILSGIRSPPSAKESPGVSVADRSRGDLQLAEGSAGGSIECAIVLS
jgi:hypothetical protein